MFVEALLWRLIFDQRGWLDLTVEIHRFEFDVLKANPSKCALLFQFLFVIFAYDSAETRDLRLASFWRMCYMSIAVLYFLPTTRQHHRVCVYLRAFL